ncbi:hypothetical protein ACMAY6_05360 [Luminiphilus sp. nBUS_16]|uniref:hypothetical protein n=1 Tax=Luminiphilus sp. nBUS_16 TaxID=3395315 RepID=UPI003EBACF1B
MKVEVRALCIVLALMSPGVFATSDADRIQQLEEQLRNQQQVLEAMQAELQRLKADVVGAGDSEPLVVTSLEEDASVAPSTAVSATTVESEPSSSAQLYGFVMADMIYDFKRVDPNWNDTLRVSTIPTDAGQFGQDGEFIFGVRQSRLGIKGNYGDDVTYLLEAELFGVGGMRGRRLRACGMLGQPTSKWVSVKPGLTLWMPIFSPIPSITGVPLVWFFIETNRRGIPFL